MFCAFDQNLRTFVLAVPQPLWGYNVWQHQVHLIERFPVRIVCLRADQQFLHGSAEIVPVYLDGITVLQTCHAVYSAIAGGVALKQDVRLFHYDRAGSMCYSSMHILLKSVPVHGEETARYAGQWCSVCA